MWDLGSGWSGAHTAATVTIGASSNLDQAATNQSFALDNVVLWAK